MMIAMWRGISFGAAAMTNQRMIVSFRVGPTLTIRSGAPVSSAMART